MRGPFGSCGRIPTHWEKEFHVKYPIKESLEKCKGKPNGKKKREETYIRRRKHQCKMPKYKKEGI